MKIDGRNGDRGDLFDVYGKRLPLCIITADTESGICTQYVLNEQGNAIAEEIGKQIVNGRIVPVMGWKTETARYAKPLKWIPHRAVSQRTKIYDMFTP